jgi:hypothetical protein
MRAYLLTLVMGWNVLICSVRAQTPEPAPSKDQPLAQVDVRQFGYERFPRREVRPQHLAVDFTDNDHVAVAWLRPDTTEANRRKAPRFGEPAHLHLVILDAKTGKEQTQKEWSTPYKPIPVLVGIPDGTLFVCTDNVLRLLSARLEVIREQELQNQGTCLETTLKTSPSKRTLLVSTTSEHGTKMELSDAKTFSTISDWAEERSKGGISSKTVAISDHWIVGYCGEPAELCLRRFDEAWQPFRPTGLDVQMSKRLPPAWFVSDEVLAVERSITTVATVHGSVLFQFSPPKKHFFSKAETSVGGETFAVREGQLRGLQSEPLDMYPFYSDDRVLVYSIKARSAIFSVKLKGTSPWAPWDIHDNVLAVSPDGMSLAVLSDELLKIYPLSKGRTAQH